MTIYNVRKAYRGNDEIYYQVLPYRLNFIIWKYFGFKHFLNFLRNSYLSEKKAKRIAEYKTKNS
jgi:hypothetical protein